MQTRRQFLWRAAVLSGGALSSWALPKTADSPSPNSEFTAAIEFLANRQSNDGAWRSDQYGAFRDGDALSPLVLCSLLDFLTPGQVKLGLGFIQQLTSRQAAQPEPWTGLHYPLFTASYSAQLLAKIGDFARANFWADLIEQLRLSPALGWSASDPASGAWGDSPTPPRIPSGTSSPPDMLAPNISATALALQALLASGRNSRCPAALPFLLQCQNRSTKDPLDRGGFFFAPGDPVRNKAGRANPDQFRSYGSATTDGVLALRACGLDSSAPPMREALDWLQLHAHGAQHSGSWPADRTDARESLRFYHAQSFADVLTFAAKIPSLTPWSNLQRHSLHADLLALQRFDGSWAGGYPDSFEDDPLVATAFSLRAFSFIQPNTSVPLRAPLHSL